jgi:hypothetical protein
VEVEVRKLNLNVVPVMVLVNVVNVVKRSENNTTKGMEVMSRETNPDRGWLCVTIVLVVVTDK